MPRTAACGQLANDARDEKARALARGLLNDSDTFCVVLDHPELPPTHTEAERALRHCVIARRIGMGARTPQAPASSPCSPASSRSVASAGLHHGPISPMSCANDAASCPLSRCLCLPDDGAPSHASKAVGAERLSSVSEGLLDLHCEADSATQVSLHAKQL